MDFSGLEQMVSNYELIGGIVVLIFALFVIPLKTFWITKFSDFLMNNIWKKIFKKKGSGIERGHILNHDIFNYIDFWMYSRIPTFQYSTEYRTIVFRRYLTIFLRKHKENLKKYITNKDFQEMSDSELWTSLLKLINDTIYDYEVEMNNQGIPPIIIQKMKVKNNDTISLTIDLIEGICTSQFYDSKGNYLRIYSILNILLAILENTISNSEHICNSINGQLRGMSVRENGREFTEP